MLDPAGEPRQVELDDVPFFPQEDYQCGPAALTTVLHHAGIDVPYRDVADRTYLPKRRGSLQLELLAETRRHGLVPYPLPPDLQSLIAEINAARPVLVLQNLGLGWLPKWHYAVVVGYDRAADQFTLRSGRERRVRTGGNEFMRTWRLADQWAMVVLGPSELPASLEPRRYLKAVSALEGAGRLDSAATAYDRFLTRYPEDVNGLLGRGNVALQQGRRRQAMDFYTRALAVNPAASAAGNNLAYALLKMDQPCAARAQIQQTLALAASDDPLREELIATAREIDATIPSPSDCHGNP
ncbi:MAG: PA2778 family cysteine peptidase [Xanthomonadales bacterium]|nr:PA2778 family cysteine peptidase [Xanthomonadales bacterium]